jgi:SAM-dependent methyltransferase
MGDSTQDGARWQVGVWNALSHTYLDELEPRFLPVVQGVLARARLRKDERVLDVGTGTGAVALGAAAAVGAEGEVLAVDVSPEMLVVAQANAKRLGVDNVTFQEARAEALPTRTGFDAVLASLSFMYVLDREAAAREVARVLRAGGRLVAAVWAGAEHCDIVRFQQTAGRFAPTPPVPGVGPGALADPSELVAQLAAAGIRARVQTEELTFDVPDFESAWRALAAVTTAGLSPDRQDEAKRAVRAAMWDGGTGPRRFRNLTQFILGERLA